MATTEQILDLADRYGDAYGVSEITVSSRVFGDSKKLSAIRNDNADLTLKRFNGALQWFSDNWPDNATWPDDLPRPTPTKLERTA